MPKTKLLRRSFLFGSAGLTLALPLLEGMEATAGGLDVPPTRYFVGFGGMSIGHDDIGYDMFTPQRVGMGYDITRGLQPLADLNVTDQVSVVTGMEMPWGPPGSVPAGGWATGGECGWHARSPPPMLTGVRGRASDAHYAPTSDWVAAEALGVTPLTYRVQVANYKPGGDGRGRMSYRDQNGNIVPVDPTVSPRLAYESLFTGFTPDTGEGQSAAALAAIRRRKSAIDLVLEDANGLLGKLGTADRTRMEQHFDELRDLENRINDIQIPTGGGSCEQPPQPGQDPGVGGNYSGEHERALVLTDLVAMAFTCNLSRVATMMYTMSQCFMSAEAFTGHRADIHDIGHHSQAVGGSQDNKIRAVTDCVAWHVGHYGRLVEQLHNRIDIDGSPVLDHCALVLMFEGGWGYDGATGKPISAHSSQNMVALIAGRAGGLNRGGGQHVRHTGGHPAQVLNTALRAIGVNQQMGEISGVVDALLA